MSSLIVDLQIVDIANAWALSTLVMEGCITPSDSYEIKSTQRRHEQVFIFKSSHIDGGKNMTTTLSQSSTPLKSNWI